MTCIFRTLIFLTIIICNAQAQTKWELVSDKEGVKVFNEPGSAEKIKPIKVECTLNASATQLIAVLLDLDGYGDWVYKTKNTRPVKQVSPSDIYYYSEVIVPWPAQPRDFVAHLTVSQAADKVITVDAPCVTGMVPVKEGTMRLTGSKGKWVLTPMGDRVKVVYYLQIDPGPGAPAFLVNMFATDGPIQTFKKLKLQLQKPAYRNAQLPFIRN